MKTISSASEIQAVKEEEEKKPQESEESKKLADYMGHNIVVPLQKMQQELIFEIDRKLNKLDVCEKKPKRAYKKKTISESPKSTIQNILDS